MPRVRETPPTMIAFPAAQSKGALPKLDCGPDRARPADPSRIPEPIAGRLAGGMESLSAMFHLQVSPLALVLRTLGAYAAMLVGFRLFGKRELGQVTVFDVAMVLLIANAVQNAMVGPDTSLLGGLIVAGTLLLANFAVARLRVRDRLLRRFVEGRPSILIANGRWDEQALRREGLDHGEVEAAMRQNGVLDAAAVRLAVLEDNGAISVVPADAPTVRFQPPRRERRDPLRPGR